MRFGRFDDEKREYVIDVPDTPLPWINYLGCESYFGLISNTAGGYSFYKDARLRRLTRYRYNNVPQDTGGRYIYLRDNASGEFWSPTWQPVRKKLDAYECRHGMGYTEIRSTYQGVKAELRYFVPMGENLEIWQVRVSNTRAAAAELSLFSSLEFCLWDALDDNTNFQRNLSIWEVEVEDSTIYHKSEYRERRDHFAYFACSEPLAGFDTNRDAFLGAYRGWETPKAVEEGRSQNSMTTGWTAIGSHHVKLNLKAGESKDLIFVLGYWENPRDAKFIPADSQIINKNLVKQTINKYMQKEAVENAFAALKTYWNSLLDKIQVETPNPHVNRMVNIWNAYQCMITFNMSRSASYYESGIGRGTGYRDSNQDLLGFVHMVPDRARERMIDLASTQLPSGGAYHQYQPLTKRGNNDVGGNFNDDPMWLVLAVAAYLKETGDWDILDVATPYDNQPGSETPLYEHLERSFKYILERIGPHGLPLIGRADWNDCLNLNCFSDTPGQSFQTTTNREGKVAESVFIGGLLVLAAREMAEIAAQLNHRDEVKYYTDEANRMEQVVLQHGWDGAWFKRAYDALGDPVGSKENKEGQIFIEPQGICIMAGIGLDDGKAIQALDSVNDHLASPHGIVLQQPAYHQYYLHMGEISSYPPGYKENAGIFCHTNPWIMIAEAMAGRGEKALDYYLRINPSAREEISEVHRCEPYVYAQMIAGKDAATHGEAKNSWLSGTAAWNYVAITQWILGVRPTYAGLEIAPSIPDDWQNMQVKREWRGVTYNINMKRVGKGSEVKLEVDGQPFEGQIVPLPSDDRKEVLISLLVGS
ncbi:MAG: glycosyl transferase [Anaerolineae bacterium]|nr:glycosyl transferase [Anaerolineae bacterium]